MNWSKRWSRKSATLDRDNFRKTARYRRGSLNKGEMPVADVDGRGVALCLLAKLVFVGVIIRKGTPPLAQEGARNGV